MPPSWPDLFAQLATILIALFAVTLPALTLSIVILRTVNVLARIGVGLATGFGSFVLLSWMVGYISFDLIIWGLGGEYVLASFYLLWIYTRRKREMKDRVAKESSSSSQHAGLIPLLAVLGLGAGIQLYGTSFSQLPPGSDPMFHCVVALQQQLEGQTSHSLWPLEKLDLNYPIGTHIWCAVVSNWTSLPIHVVFRHSFLIAMIGCGLMAAAWGEELVPGSGPWACFCYFFMSYQASFYPYSWGGLPSTMGMWIGMASLFTAIRLEGRVSWIATVLLSGTVAMVHHHAMIALWAGIGVVCVINAVRVNNRSTAIRCLTAHALGAILAAPQSIRLLSHLFETNRTSIGHFLEPYSSPWEQLWSWGPMLVVFGFLGCFIKRIRSRTSGVFFLQLGVVWILSFVCLDYGARWITRIVSGTESTPFTPSRFLFDFQHLFAVLAGCAVFGLQEKLNPARQRIVGAIVVTASILILFGDMTATLPWKSGAVQPRWRAMPEDQLLEVGQWVNSNIPEHAVILGPASGWMTYICQREATGLFIPISEPIDQARQGVKDDLVQHPFSKEWEQWRLELEKPLYAVLLSNRPIPEQTPIRRFGRITVYELAP